jgi:hypothetical protein
VEISHCSNCGREFGPNLALVGWQPCICGGHRYVYCREDTGGCGEYSYRPPKSEETCQPVAFGYDSR